MEEEVLDDEEEAVETPKRRGPPRFGSFVTIAAAILLLFGAASRVGKVEETLSLFGIDRASQRIHQEEERLRTAITIGAVPVRRDDLHSRAGSVPVRTDVQPPYRGEIDPEEVRGGRPNLSIGIAPNTRVDDNFSDGQGAFDERNYSGNTPGSHQPNRSNGVQPPVSAVAPVPTVAVPGRQDFYVVANGDTWNKIALKTLGDGNRWQEIRNANPSAQTGLVIGMKLAIPREAQARRGG